MSKGGRGPLGMKFFGWHPVKLCSNYTRDELHALERATMQDSIEVAHEHEYPA